MEVTQPASRPGDKEAAQYIATMAHELRAVAAKADLGFLAYLLSMVEDEATTNTRKQAEQSKGT